MRVYPVPGSVILDPHTKQPVPFEGKDVPEDTYWHLALRDGDLTLEKPEALVEFEKAEAARLAPPEVHAEGDKP